MSLLCLFAMYEWPIRSSYQLCIPVRRSYAYLSTFFPLARRNRVRSGVRFASKSSMGLFAIATLLRQSSASADDVDVHEREHALRNDRETTIVLLRQSVVVVVVIETKKRRAHSVRARRSCVRRERRGVRAVYQTATRR